MLLAKTKKEAHIFIIIISLAFAINFHAFSFPDNLATQLFAGIACILSSDLVVMLIYQIKRGIIV